MGRKPKVEGSLINKEIVNYINEIIDKNSQSEYLLFYEK